MKNKKITLLTIGIIGVLMIYISDFLYRSTPSISNNLYRNFIEPLFYIFLSLSILSFISIFLKDEIFKTWSKFTYIWIPISIILTLITPGGSGSFFVSLWDKETTAIFMSGLYVIIPLIIVIWKSIKIYCFKKI